MDEQKVELMEEPKVVVSLVFTRSTSESNPEELSKYLEETFKEESIVTSYICDLC